MPDLKFKTPPDQDQRDLILQDLDSSILVEAAAGTGKTTSMIGRMAALLATGKCAVNTIAAVTFTRKAAAELRARFRIALESAAASSTGDEKKRLDDALAGIDRCYIGTIHSFCARLLRERPVDAGVGIAFEELEDEEDRLLLQTTWDNYVAKLHVDDSPILSALTESGIDISDLFDVYSKLSTYPDVDEWPASNEGLPDFKSTRPALKSYLDHIRSILDLLPAYGKTDKLIPKYQDALRIERQTNFDDPVKFADLLKHFTQTATVVLKHWPAIEGMKNSEFAKSELALWNEFREEYALPLYTKWLEYRYSRVLDVVMPAIAIYEERKQNESKLNFQDLLMKTAGLLRSSEHVRRYFRKRFTHVLVDEFQDTDPVQAEIMMLLTASDHAQNDWKKCSPVPGSLFVVGDPKQSIYRFRRADIATYNFVKNRIDETGGRLLSLTAGFRTVPEIIDWVNDTFGRIFPAEETVYSPARRDLAAARADGASGVLKGTFRITIPGDPPLPPAEYEADLIARFIRNSIDTNAAVPRTLKETENGVSTAARPQDFLIITFNKKLLSTYAAALQRLAIPHQVTGGTAMNESFQLAMLASCFRAVTEPENPVALVSVLRGSLFGISDTVLYEFRKCGGRFDFTAGNKKSIEAMENRAGAKQLHDALQRLNGYYRRTVSLAPITAVEILCADLGLYAAAAIEEGGNENAGSLLKAIELLRASALSGLTAADAAEFLESLTSTDSAHDSMPARAPGSSVVRVMNLHKSKGLEAPVVFLAGAAGKGNFGPDFHVDRSGDITRGYTLVQKRLTHKAITFAQPPGWDALSEIESRFSDAEKERLMYVAATRAGTMLSIVQKEKRNNNNIWNFFNDASDAHPPLDDPGPQSAPATDVVETSVKEIGRATETALNSWRACSKPTYAAGPAKSLSVFSRGTHFNYDERATRWGEVIHTVLELAIRNPETDLRAIAESALIDSEFETGILDETLKTIDSVIASEIWKRAGAANSRLVEVPMAAMLPRDRFRSDAAKKIDPAINEILVRGVIDLAFEENGEWIIVDYKTDRVRGGDTSALEEKYFPQVDTYAAAWLVSTGRPVKEIGLYFTSASKYVSRGVKNSRQ